MRAGERELDIVLYGATGFIGKLIAEYLASTGSGIRVGLGGRSAERLRAVRQSLSAGAQDWPVVVADLSQPAALQAMAARTQVVVSAVGPYSRHGLPVVGACAAAGTDYVDLSGEVPFVRNSIDLYHRQAADSGARIVHSCGFDSIPSDLTVYALHRLVSGENVGQLGETTLVLRAYSGGYAGGSLATMVELMRIAAEDPKMRHMLDDPYSLSPDRSAEPELGFQQDLPLCEGSEIAPELSGMWIGGYLMALYNTRCVRRTNALLGFAYGRQFRYQEALTMGTTPAAPAIAAMFNAGIATASRLGGWYLKMLPPGLLNRMMPVGIGHDEGARGRYKVETYTKTTNGRRFVATMAQHLDPGYAATAVLAGESALCLALDRERLSNFRGVLTPAAAMGDAILGRLANAGVTIDITELD